MMEPVLLCILLEMEKRMEALEKHAVTRSGLE
jgi:hypothetical protein